MSLPSRFSVLVRGIQLARQRRIGDLLHAHDHVHGFTSYRRVAAAPKPEHRSEIVRSAMATAPCVGESRRRTPERSGQRCRSACDTVRGLADPARRQLVRVLGDGAQHRRRAPSTGPRSRRRGRRDQPARPCHTVRPRRGPARVRRGHRLRRRRHAQRGRDRDRRHRHRARRAAGRLDQRVRPHARPARTTRSTPPITWLAGIDAADFRPIGLGTGQRPLLLLPHRHRVRRRRRPGRRAAGLAEALARASAVHHRRPHDLAARATTAVTRTSRRRAATHGAIDDGYFSIVLNTNPYTYLGNRPLDLSPAATLDRGLVVVTFRTLRVAPILRGLGAALRGGGVATSDASRRVARRRPPDRARCRAVPLPARRRLPRLGRSARVRPRPRRRPAGLPRSGLTTATWPSASAELGADGESRCRARWCRCRRRPSRSAPHAVGVVAGPDVDRQAERVGGTHERFVDRSLPGVDRAVPDPRPPVRRRPRTPSGSTTPWARPAAAVGTRSTVAGLNDEISQRASGPRRSSSDGNAPGDPLGRVVSRARPARS